MGSSISCQRKICVYEVVTGHFLSQCLQEWLSSKGTQGFYGLQFQRRLKNYLWTATNMCIFLKVSQLCPALCNSIDYTVQGILQARILEWVAYPFSSGSSWPRNQTGVSCIAGRFFTSWGIKEALKYRHRFRYRFRYKRSYSLLVKFTY